VPRNRAYLTGQGAGPPGAGDTRGVERSSVSKTDMPAGTAPPALDPAPETASDPAEATVCELPRRAWPAARPTEGRRADGRKPGLAQTPRAFVPLAPPVRDQAPSPLAAPVRLDDRPSRGEATAPVVLVEYGDFECPYCAQAAPVLRELLDTSGGLVRHVFRHFPIFEVHRFALTAALAAEVAHAHDRFWPMHDLLYAHQSRLKDIDLRIRAERLGLDPAGVVGEPAQLYGDAVEADYEHGVNAGVRGTPTILINGQPFRGRPELPALRRAVHIAASAALMVQPPPTDEADAPTHDDLGPDDLGPEPAPDAPAHGSPEQADPASALSVSQPSADQGRHRRPWSRR
jgi:protein-disulfide isomerase